MKTLVIGIVGILLFIFSVGSYLIVQLAENRAQALDDENKSYGMISGEFLPCSWEVKAPERVMTESKSQAILVDFSNPTDATCASTLALQAPGFDISPMKEEQEIVLQPHKNGSLSWILSPRKVGTYDIAVSDTLDTHVFGISVTNVFGLSAPIIKSGSILGSLFGPMFTVPWWWDRMRKRKEKPAEENNV